MKKILSIAVTFFIICPTFSMLAPQVKSQSGESLWDVFYDANVLPEELDPPFEPGPDNVCYIKEVSDGILHISTLFPELEPWYIGCWFSYDWDADASVGFTVEARIRLIRYEGAPAYGGMGVWAANFDSEAILLLNPDRVFEYWSDKSFYMDTTDDFHIYRLAVLGNDYWIYVDGVLRLQGNTGSYNRRLILFGDGSALANAEALWDYVAFTTTGALPPSILATIDINPDTLNLKSNGEWVTAYIELAEGHNVSDIDVNSILLNGTIPVDVEAPMAVGDYDLDNIPDLMVKFDRATIIQWLDTNDYGEDTGKYYEVNLTITGAVTGTQFSGTDRIKVLKK